MAPTDHQDRVEALLDWLYRDELRHSRLIWRLEADRRLDPPWPYEGLWYDRAGAAMIDLRAHPTLGDPDHGLPWYQIAGDDPVAMELLLAAWLPPTCEVLADTELLPILERLGHVGSSGRLQVRACAPGELLGGAAPCRPTRLTLRHRALVAENDWRPDDLADEIDESRGGVRWALLDGGHLLARLVVQPVSRQVVEVADVHTRPDQRRQGHAAALLTSVVRRLHERGLTVTYSVHPSNLPSIRLAASLGFTPRFSWERYLLERVF